MNLNFIFDLDGTLIDTRNLVLKSINDVFVNGGVKNWDQSQFGAQKIDQKYPVTLVK